MAFHTYTGQDNPPQVRARYENTVDPAPKPPAAAAKADDEDFPDPPTPEPARESSAPAAIVAPPTSTPTPATTTPENESAKTAEKLLPNPWTEHIEDAVDIMAEELPAIVEIVEGIMASQSKLVIASGAKSFKTYLTIDMVFAVSHGIPWLGRKTRRTKVLYVNLELKTETYKRRVQAIAKARGVVVEEGWFFHLSLRGKMAGVFVSELVSRILQIVAQYQIGLVVIDPVFKANTEGDENSSRDQTVFFNQLDRITTEGGCTLVLNDHFAKGNQSEKDPLDSIRGSSAKMGDLDAAMILRKHQVEGCFRVDMIHRELPPVAPFCLGWRYPLMELRTDLDPDAMKKPKVGKPLSYDLTELLSYIQETTAEKSMSISAWSKAAGVQRSTLRDYLPKLRTKGWVRTVGEGNKSGQFITESGLEVLKKESV